MVSQGHIKHIVLPEELTLVHFPLISTLLAYSEAIKTLVVGADILDASAESIPSFIASVRNCNSALVNFVFTRFG